MATLVNAGLERKARLVCGDSSSNFQWTALGSGSTAESNSDTALATEITTNGGARMIGDTVAYEADYKAKWVSTWTFSGALAINECGVFDQLAVGGTMLFRHVFAATKNVVSGDTLQITFYETESRA
ncbi:MAG: hypothetical protein SVK08_01300 [Halobacteriota archaeon]|nr:hypothetical protein [Halobacteriota archaeon]